MGDQLQRLCQAAADADRDGGAEVGVAGDADHQLDAAQHLLGHDHAAAHPPGRLTHAGGVGQAQRHAPHPGLVSDVVDLDDDRIADLIGGRRGLVRGRAALRAHV